MEATTKQNYFDDIHLTAVQLITIFTTTQVPKSYSFDFILDTLGIDDTYVVFSFNTRFNVITKC